MPIQSGFGGVTSSAPRSIVDGSDVKLYRAAVTAAANRDANALAKSLLGDATVPTGSTGGTGVFRAPYIDPFTAAMLRSRGGGGGGFSFTGTGGEQQQAGGIDWNAILQASQKPYASMSERLKTMTEAERQRISQATNMATTMLGEVDPMAGYRESFQALQAPTAAASTYLGAIGADPAQVEAQRNLANQLMAQQAAGQQGFAGAIDRSNQNYRLAQLAEAYANQQRAQYGLEATSGAQQTAIDMAATAQRNQFAQMMLEAQLRLLEIQAQQNKGRVGSSIPTITASSLGF